MDNNLSSFKHLEAKEFVDVTLQRLCSNLILAKGIKMQPLTNQRQRIQPKTIQKLLLTNLLNFLKLNHKTLSKLNIKDINECHCTNIAQKMIKIYTIGVVP